MTGYELSKVWFDWSFENPEKVSPNHSAIFFFAIEHCNRLGWKTKFGFPTQIAMDAIGIKKHETYIRYFNDLCDWGFFNLIQKSTNQYSSNIISLNSAIPKNGEALGKAIRKHGGKQTQPMGESIGESNSSINKLLTKELNKQITKETTTIFVDEESTALNPVNDFLKKETAFIPKPVNAKLPTVKKEKGAGAEASPKSPSAFTACIEVYNQFMIQRTGLPGKFDGQEGKGMVAIVAYLASVSIEKTDQGTINSWRHILSLIEKWDPYHKNQLKLSQINSNLINIINSIKNGNSKQINNSYSTNKYRTPTGQQPV